MNVEMPELPEPMNRMAAGETLNAKDGYEVTKDDERMLATGSNGQLIGHAMQRVQVEALFNVRRRTL